MKEVWTDSHQQSKAACHRQGLKERHGQHGEAKKHVSASQALGEDLDKHLKGRLPPGEEVSRNVCDLPLEHSLFLEANKSSNQSKVSQLCHLWVERSIGNRGS